MVIKERPPEAVHDLKASVKELRLALDFLPPAFSGRARLAELLDFLTGKRYLRSGDAARFLGVRSVNTVKNWMESGYLPGSKRTAKGHWLFRRSDLFALRARLADDRARSRAGRLEPIRHVDSDPSDRVSA